MNIGYARVSTEDQTLDLQLDALKSHGCESIYQEHASGKTALRPELEQALKALRPGDALVVWRLDRLGRNLHDLVRIVSDLEGRGVGFTSLTEQIATGSPSGKGSAHTSPSAGPAAFHMPRSRPCRHASTPPPTASWRPRVANMHWRGRL